MTALKVAAQRRFRTGADTTKARKLSYIKKAARFIAERLTIRAGSQTLASPGNFSFLHPVKKHKINTRREAALFNQAL